MNMHVFGSDETYIKISAQDWSVHIDPQYGANPVRVRYRGEDVLRPIDAGAQNPYLVGAPLLLPANRTAGGRFTFGGKEYKLPVNEMRTGAHLHGDLYHQTFAVGELTETRAVLTYENRGEIYPFPFRFVVTYEVGAEGFRTVYRIENMTDTPMPFAFAPHITFTEPEWFQVPIRLCQEKDGFHIPTGRYVPLNDREQDYVTGSPSKGLEISGYYLACGDTARIGPDFTYRAEGFDHWILFNGKGESGLLCIEPQIGGVNCLNSEKDCPVLAGRESKTFVTVIKRTT